MIDYTSNLREVYLDVKKGKRVINYPDTYQGINHHQEENDKEERPWRHGLESYKSYYS